MSPAPTLGALLAASRHRLRAAGIDTADIDARLLVEAATGTGRLDALTDSGREIPAEDIARLDGWLARRARGEPVGRILGHASFYGLDLALGPDTLEPRPDTELLVETALAAVRAGRLPGVRTDGDGLAFLDIGTGTGAIAVTLLHKLPAATGLATDLSEGALAVARANAVRHGVADRLDFAAGSYFEPVEGKFALIVSNPPYIASAVIPGLDAEVRLNDPLLALDGGPDGLDAYRAIIAAAPAHLLPGGLVALEIGWDQGEAVSALLIAAGFAGPVVHRDLGGRNRVVAAMLSDEVA